MQERSKNWRYPGPRSFGDNPIDQALFYGREEEIRVLFQLLLISNLAVLYGRSGVGKTSLLQAGLFPLLRAKGFVPLPISLKEGTKEMPFESLLASAQREAQTKIDALVELENRSWTLWDFFQQVHFTRGDREQLPVLVIDDFDQIFGLYSPKTRRAILAELGSLISRKAPKWVKTSDRGEHTRELSRQEPQVKLIIALDQQLLGSLDEFRDCLPELLQHRLCLHPLSRQQARTALEKPARAPLVNPAVSPFELDERVIDNLLNLVRLTRPSAGDGRQEPFDPFLLQIVCAHIENWLQQREQAEDAEKKALQLDVQELQEHIRYLLLNYYEDRLNSIPGERQRRLARRLMESSLHGKISQNTGLSRVVINKTYGVSDVLLQNLVQNDLLRECVGAHGFEYALRHDALLQPISLTRKHRRRKKMRAAGIATVAVLFAILMVNLISTYVLPSSRKPPRELYWKRKAYLVSNPKKLESFLREEIQTYPQVHRSYLDLIDLLKQQGRIREAMEVLQQISAMKANSPHALAQQAEFNLAIGQIDEAQKFYEQAKRLIETAHKKGSMPPLSRIELASFYQSVGMVNHKLGRVTGAAESYRAAMDCLNAISVEPMESDQDIIRLRDAKVSVYFSLGQLFASQNLLEIAVENYTEALKIRPNHSDALEARAEAYHSLKLYREAIQDYDAILREHPGNIIAALKRAEIHLDRGHYELALQDFDGIIKTDPENATSYFHRATALSALHREKEALADFDTSLKLRPDNIPAVMGRAKILLDQGDYEAAEGDYTSAIELDPTYLPAYGNRGICRRHLGKEDEAIEDYTRIINLDPQNAQAYYLRGNIHLNQKKLDQALEDFNNSINLDSKFAKAYNNRGFTLSSLGKFKEAIEDFTQAIELDPMYGEAYSNRGFAIFYYNQDSSAIADFDRAILLDPLSYQSLINRGNYYLEIEEYELAIADFTKAININPEANEAYKGRGVAYEHLGQTPKAEADWLLWKKLAKES